MLSYFLLIASIVAFYGSLLSVTRGAWLAYLFMLLIWLVYVIKQSFFDKKHLLSKPVLFRLLFAIIIFFSVSQTEQYQVLKSRTQSTIDNLSSGNYEGASSSRIHIFKDVIKYGAPEHRNSLKVAKRLWLISTLNKNRTLAESLAPLFISPASAISQVISESEVVRLILEKVSNPPVKVLMSQILGFEKRLKDHNQNIKLLCFA